MGAFTNMNKRDKNMLLLLLVVLVFYVCYAYVITPALTLSEGLKSDIIQLEADIRSSEETLAKSEELETELLEMKEEVNDKYSVFLGSLDDAEILYKIDTVMSGVDLKADSYMPAEVVYSKVAVERGVYEQFKYPLLEMAEKIEPQMYPVPEAVIGESEETTEEVSPDSVALADITINFYDVSYDKIYNFMQGMEDLDKTITLKDIEISKAEEGLTGHMTYSLYVLPVLSQDHKDELKFTSVIPRGKVNPFQSVGVGATNENQEDN